MAIIPRNSLGDTDQKAIRDQLDRLLHSRQFEKSRRRRQFLEYIVNETLAGRADLSAALGYGGRTPGFAGRLRRVDDSGTYGTLIVVSSGIEARFL